MSTRTISVAGETYSWRVGARHVAIRTPAGVEHTPEIAEVLRSDGWTVQRGQHKRTSDAAVTPRYVAAWILDNIVGDPFAAINTLAMPEASGASDEAHTPDRAPAPPLPHGERVFVVTAEANGPGWAAHEVVAVRTDPQVARELARSLNAEAVVGLPAEVRADVDDRALTGTLPERDLFALLRTHAPEVWRFASTERVTDRLDLSRLEAHLQARLSAPAHGKTNIATFVDDRHGDSS